MNSTLRTIVEKIRNLKLYEERKVTDEYVEVVFFNEDLTLWNEVFNEILGEPKKKPDMPPDKEDQLLAEEYGGIWPEQTLFKKDFENGGVIAMFWPWKDKVHTTLKAAVVKK